MAVLGPTNARVEVRVIKLPGKPDDITNPVYFDEYTTLGDRKVPEKAITRCIVPEVMNYGVEVKFKAGFQHGEFDGHIALLLKDKTSGVVLYGEWVHQVQGTHFSQDTTFYITTLPSVVVDGKKMKDAKLAFHGLLQGEYHYSFRMNIANPNLTKICPI